MAPRAYTRRKISAVLGVGLASGLAGCFDGLSDSDSDSDPETTAASPTRNETTMHRTATEGTTTVSTTEPTTVEPTTADETTTAATTTTADKSTTTATTTTTTDGKPVKTDDPYATNQDGNAAVRVAHMSPGAPKVDISVDGTTVITRLAFGQVSPYFVLEPGSHHVSVSPSGLPTTVFSETVQVGPKTYSIVAVGEMEGGNHPLAFRQFGDVVDPLSPAKTRIRLVHAVPDAEQLDVTMPTRGDSLFESVDYGTQSSYAHPSAGQVRLEIRRGTRANNGGVMGTFDVNLPGGAVLTAFANGYRSPENAPADAPFGLRVVIDARS